MDKLSNLFPKKPQPTATRILTEIASPDQRQERRLYLYSNNYQMKATDQQVHKFKISIAPCVSPKIFGELMQTKKLTQFMQSIFGRTHLRIKEYVYCNAKQINLPKLAEFEKSLEVTINHDS
jgi:hypothetical protein